MCGIAGIIRHTGLTPADRARAARLRTLLAHRGPDGDGVSVTPTAAFVQTRLALVDPHPHPLPLQSPDGRYTLLYNGEIYNHAGLRRQLPRACRTNTDTEVVLSALELWGPAALPRFEGMFALFFWDSKTRVGLAAVDPLSVKPFLYHASASQFIFSSEAGPLLESGLLPFRPHDESIAEYLTAPYFSAAHSLPFSNLQRLLPGHYLELRHGRVTTAEYTPSAEVPPALLPALRHAVETQSVAPGGVGLFLSGGVDSSLLAALAPSPSPAFTIDYALKPTHFHSSLIVRDDDLPHARRVADLFGHPHHTVAAPRYEAALRRTLHANDLIAAWEQEVSQNLLAEAAAPRVKAVLVGDAADETHFGYSFLLHPDRTASPGQILEYFGTLPTRPGPEHFVDKYRRFAGDRGHNWHTPAAQRLAVSSLIRHLWLTRLLHNGDLHLMAHGVEGRVPYAHPAILAFAALHDGLDKPHLRAAAAELLPPEIAHRPKSALTKNLAARPIVHRLFRQAWQRHGAFLEPYIDPDFVAALPPPQTDRDTGLRFRLLALLTWFARWNGEPAP